MIDTLPKTGSVDHLDDLEQAMDSVVPKESPIGWILESCSTDQPKVGSECDRLNGDKTDYVNDTDTEVCQSQQTDVGDSLCCINETTTHERILLPTVTPTLKREKSSTDTIERKKKRVKFNPQEDNEEVLVHTHVFEKVSPLEALIQDSSIISNAPLAFKLKRLLKNKSKCCKNYVDISSDQKIRPDDEISSVIVNMVDEEEFTFIDEDSEEKEKEPIKGLDGKEMKDENSVEKSFKNILQNIEPSPTAIKRESTFSLDGSPPAKAMRPSISVENINQEEMLTNRSKTNETPDTESSYDNTEPLGATLNMKMTLENKYFVDKQDIDCIKNNSTIDETNVDECGDVTLVTKPCQAWKNLRINNSFELKADSLASKRRAKVNVEKKISCSIGQDKEEANDAEINADKTKVTSFRDSAKKTLINAWKSAMKGSLGENCAKIDPSSLEQNAIMNSKKIAEKLCHEDKQSTEATDGKSKLTSKKCPGEQKNRSGMDAFHHYTQSKGAIPKIPKIKPFTCDVKNETRKERVFPTRADKSPVVGTVLPFRRDGTFTKCPAKWTRQIDNEKIRLETELRRISSERDRLQCEVVELRHWAEGEEAARKAMRREHLQRVRQVKDEEAKKRDLLVAELKNRLEEEHRDALMQQKAALHKATEMQLQKLERERADELKKLRQEIKTQVDKVKFECKKEYSRPENRISYPGNNKEQERLAVETTALRLANKRLEETLQRVQESEKGRVAELRAVQCLHDAATAAHMKTTRQEAAKMMEELKCKDRTICQLEKQVGHATGKIQLLEQVRSNSSPGHQPNKSSPASNTNKNIKSNNKNNTIGTKQKQQQQQRDDSVATEASGESWSMDGYRGAASEVARLREEVDQQKRTIRQLTLRIPRDMHRDDQPMSLGTIPSISMDNMYDGLLRPLLPRGRHDAPSSSCDWSSLVSDLKEENRNLKSELQEARDQADLLEFRILELTEGSDRFSESDETSSIREVTLGGGEYEGATQVGEEAGTASQCALQNEDLSLPLSIDSGLDLTADNKKTRSGSQSSATRTVTTNTTTTSTTPNSQTTTTNNVPATTTSTSLSPTAESTMANPLSKVDIDQHSTERRNSRVDIDSVNITDIKTVELKSNELAELKSNEIVELAARLQESLATPKLQEEALLDAINHLRLLGSSLSTLEGRVLTLTDENQYLQDAVSALSDAHETRTEASGTESEIVNNRKTPSLHSDLSDSESDSVSSTSDGNRSSKRLEVSSSFQESGIFDGPCEVNHISTQTESYSCDGSAPQVVIQQEVQEDLSSAVARLTSIRSAVQGGGVQMRLHELQEGEELGKTVVPTDPEYKASSDILTAGEQSLHLEIVALKDHLGKVKAENNQLQEAYDGLNEKISTESKRRCYENAEVVKGESRVLREQLRISECSRRTLYDEKCELEEAENDARLMVQRLDSQLTAAREMECLLSASLSQEQEISRELHRKVKELQAIEKERSFRQGILERQSMNSVERVAGLVMERDNYASQLAFAKTGLMMAEAFKFLYTNYRGTLVPYSEPKCHSIEPRTGESAMHMEISPPSSFVESISLRGGTSCVMVNCAIDEALMEISDDDVVTCSSSAFINGPVNGPSRMDYSTSFSIGGIVDTKDGFSSMPVGDYWIPRLCNMSVQTDPVRFYNESQNSYTALESQTKDVSLETRVSNVTLIDVQTSQVLGSTVSKPSVDTRTRSTMTCEEDLLSQRERYYLEQIQSLQDEKMSLRKDQEQERLDSLHQYDALENNLEELQQQLIESDRVRTVLQCQVEESREKREASCRDLQRRMEDMRGDMGRCSDLHELEKKALRRDFDARLSEISDERQRFAERVTELEQQLSALRKELEVVGVAIVTDMTDYDGQPHAATVRGDKLVDLASKVAANSSSRASHISSGSELLDKIRQLIKSESSLRQKITELEQKESAYHQTMQKADQIMSNQLTTYTQRIEELESIHEQCLCRISLLEKNEDRLRSSLKSNVRSGQDSRIAELLQQLINTEKSELELKGKLWSLEKNEKQLQIKLMEGEKTQQSLRAELRDQEELVQKMLTLQTENNTLTQRLQKAHDGVRRMCEVQQSEHFLKGRIEELEASEHVLKEALHQTDAAKAHSERRLMEQVAALEEEIQSFKSQLEAACIRDTDARETELSLRKQLEQVKERLQESERDLKESSCETINYENQHRSEVCKMRTQLKLVNSQLSELDSISCSLRERLAASEQLRENLERQLEERKRRHESDLLQLNLQVSERELRLEEAECQLCELTQLHAAQDLDLLAQSALGPVLKTAQTLANNFTVCEVCAARHSNEVDEFKGQLRILTDLLNGSPQSDTEDNEADDSEDDENTENMASLESTNRPLPLVGEGCNIPSEGILTCPPATIPPSSAPGMDSPSSHTLTLNSSATSNSPILPMDRSPTHGSTPVTVESSTHSSLSSDCFSTADESSGSIVIKVVNTMISSRPGSPVPVPAPRRKRKQKRDDTATLRGSFRARKKGTTTILEELEEKVRELEESTARKEEELRLADSEAAELSSRLTASQELTAVKESEVCEVRRALSALQEQLVISIEAHEYTKIALESKYKTGKQNMVVRVHNLTLQLERLAERGSLKDHIIATLVTQIRAILRTTNMGVVIRQIQQVGDRIELSKQRKQQQQQQQNSSPDQQHQMLGEQEEEEQQDEEEQDFDIEAVCQLLDEPREQVLD